MTIPRATLRLQFHRGFTYDDAFAHVDYFARLGVSHLYASPITTAQPGSMHGYDTVDYSLVSPECGGEPGLRRLAERLHERGMGLIVDVVPNHMGVVGADNAWWLDVLEWGRSSAYSRHFDIDWDTPNPSLHDKVLLPILGRPYGEELAAGRIALKFDAASGRFQIEYGEHVCPVCPTDYHGILTSARANDLGQTALCFAEVTEQPYDRRRMSAATDALRDYVAGHGAAVLEPCLHAYSPDTPVTCHSLHELLERQHFRLAWWRTASDEINWRRFFNITTLAGVRVERPEVFEASHGLILRLYREGVIDGVRIDHIDGLAQPREYCARLWQRLREQRTDEPYIVVEKILARGEPLREDWAVDGTTGYDFMNDAGALLHDPQGAVPLATAWAELSGRSADFHDEASIARHQVLTSTLSAELDRTARALHRIAGMDSATRDYTFAAIRRVLIELVTQFTVYRIYPEHGARSLADNEYFEPAVARARRNLYAGDGEVLERVAGWLGGAPRGGSRGAVDETEYQQQILKALTLFSQLTAPVAAKAVEDTACYRYGRLLSRNEVGADPGEFAMSAEAFHRANAERSWRFPNAMLATATHDHKRGEDVRARLAVLSEMPGEWIAIQHAWSQLNAPLRRKLPSTVASSNDTWAPGPMMESMLYQTLVGCWPLDLEPDDEAGVMALIERVAQWQLKAMREAKLRTSWLAPDEAYEAACREFLFDIVETGGKSGFLAALHECVQRVARAGAINSLTQTVLRMTSPGVPDLYQGTELWDFSLVDPDNRRPVDFAQRAAWLTGEPPSAFLETWREGRVKLAVVQRVLALRAQEPELFAAGDYLPLTLRGSGASQAIAFARRNATRCMIVVLTRLSLPLLDAAGELPIVPAQAWGDTWVELAPIEASGTFSDCLADTTHTVTDNGRIYLRDLLASMPVAVLHARNFKDRAPVPPTSHATRRP